ncbi:MAG: polyphosphate:AMP phosphotransferase [Deferribacteraceae bacterium]|jgi:polyphosphate:AMP phosphotransferase|nr:polyphosphate:AMP phosphotransferase [Deferribacteraceae bacterium]
MFESAELDISISKDEYNDRLPQARLDLFTLRQELKEAGIAVLLLIDGVPGAGRGDLINLLNEWMDSRSIRNRSFWMTTDEERAHPEYWRYWRILPAKGELGIFFGGWYERAVKKALSGKGSELKFEKAMAQARNFEQTLAADGMLIIKLWLHLDKETHNKIMKKRAEHIVEMDPFANETITKTSYEDIIAHYLKAIRLTGGWQMINCRDSRNRNITAIEAICAAMRGALAEKPTPPAIPIMASRPARILDSVDLSKSLNKKEYKEELEKCQRDLHNLTLKALSKGISTVILFEGWDAAGKGSSIRRITTAIDARIRQTIQTAAPSDEELAHHYLWRFWRHIPLAGLVTIYDRSWYGRVMVERVEGFARADEWFRAYSEINNFEGQLVDDNVVLVKFWLHISQEEQLKRFQAREASELKRWKITDEDWRNREKIEAYNEAIDDMLVHTSTDIAPWTLIPAEDKYFARVEVIKTICERLKRALK